MLLHSVCRSCRVVLKELLCSMLQGLLQSAVVAFQLQTAQVWALDSNSKSQDTKRRKK